MVQEEAVRRPVLCLDYISTDQELLAQPHPPSCGLPRTAPHNNNKKRIQLLDEVIGVLVVLSEKAEGYSSHRVVAPGTVETAE